MVISVEEFFENAWPILFEMSCSDVKVYLIFCTIYQTLLFGVAQFNLETKLGQRVR